MTHLDKSLLKEKILKRIMLEQRLTHAEAEKVFKQMNIAEKDYDAVAGGKGGIVSFSGRNRNQPI